jgi:hypothetical protein
MVIVINVVAGIKEVVPAKYWPAPAPKVEVAPPPPPATAT